MCPLDPGKAKNFFASAFYQLPYSLSLDVRIHKLRPQWYGLVKKVTPNSEEENVS